MHRASHVSRRSFVGTRRHRTLRDRMTDPRAIRLDVEPMRCAEPKRHVTDYSGGPLARYALRRKRPKGAVKANFLSAREEHPGCAKSEIFFISHLHLRPPFIVH